MNLARRLAEYLRATVDLRRLVAHLLMVIFVVGTTTGAFLIYVPAGWVTLGVTSGIVGYLLGAD